MLYTVYGIKYHHPKKYYLSLVSLTVMFMHIIWLSLNSSVTSECYACKWNNKIL